MQATGNLSADTIVHGRYRIVRLVARGGVGAVYEAIDQRLNRSVALKQMLGALTETADAPPPSGLDANIEPALLRNVLEQRFNQSELQMLCFDLGIEYEHLPSGSKADKARELVLYCHATQHLKELGVKL